MSPISDVEKRVKEIRRKTRRKYSAEDKIRIVLEGLRGEMTIAELCRREGIVQNLYYKWRLVDVGTGEIVAATVVDVTGSVSDLLTSGNRNAAVRLVD